MSNGGVAVVRRLDGAVRQAVKPGSVYSKTVQRPLLKLDNEERRDVFCVKCGECTESFSVLSDLSNHLRHQHFDHEVYVCGICSRFFLFHPELEDHLLAKHLQSDPGKDTLKRAPDIHLDEISRFIAHSEQRERVELQCPFCQCIYNKLALYQQHMSVAHKHKAWDKDGLCSAVLRVTEIGPRNKSDTPVILLSASEKVPSKVYCCDRCEKKVYGCEPLKRHASTHHDATLYQCCQCSCFYISQEKLEFHLTSDHLSLESLNITQNKYGDIIGQSMDDILNANDCLSRHTCTNDHKQSQKGSNHKQPQMQNHPDDESVFIDLDAPCIVTHETVSVPTPKSIYTEAVIKPQMLVALATSRDLATTSRDVMTTDKDCSVTRPNWMFHKRSRSDDSLPDESHPLHDMLLLCKYAEKEHKRIAAESQKVDTKTEVKEEILQAVDTKPNSNTVIKRVAHVVQRVTADDPEALDACLKDKEIVRYATWFLCVQSTLIHIAAYTLYNILTVA